jgi:hypothetical protein
MIVLPAHGALDHVMEHLEAAGDRHIDRAPDIGLDVIEADAQARDDLLCHAATLPAKPRLFALLRLNRGCWVSSLNERPKSGSHFRPLNGGFWVKFAAT